MRLDDLSDLQRLVIDALVDAPLAWQAPDQLARSAGTSIDLTSWALVDLDLAGWIVPWHEPPVGPYPWPGPVVTFTPRGAESLGVRIIEVGPDETPRWARADAPDPFPPKAKGIFRDFGSLGLVIDPAPSPLDLVIEAEEATSQKPRRRGRRDCPAGAWAEARRAWEARERRKRRRRARLGVDA